MAQMCGPVQFPCPMPAIGAYQVALEAEIVESPKVVQM